MLASSWPPPGHPFSLGYLLLATSRPPFPNSAIWPRELIWGPVAGQFLATSRPIFPSSAIWPRDWPPAGTSPPPRPTRGRVSVGADKAFPQSNGLRRLACLVTSLVVGRPFLAGPRSLLSDQRHNQLNRNIQELSSTRTPRDMWLTSHEATSTGIGSHLARLFPTSFPQLRAGPNLPAVGREGGLTLPDSLLTESRSWEGFGKSGRSGVREGWPGYILRVRSGLVGSGPDGRVG